MARQLKNHTIHRGITALSVFNGDELMNIVGGKIQLPITYAPKSFRGYFALTFHSTVSSLTVSTPITDPCTDAYGLPWRWSTFAGCSSVSTMPLMSYTHRPSAWRNTECGKPYEKRWVREPHVSPGPPLTSINLSTFGACRRGFITWTASTHMWSVSTTVGATVTDLPYTLKYTSDGAQPYTVSYNEDTTFKIQACQPVVCEQAVNSINIYVDAIGTPEVYNDLVAAVNTTIRPRFVQYLLTNGHPSLNANELVQVIPILNKRHFNSLTTTGIVPLTGHGNTNVSLVFIDIPAYITCTNASRTSLFESDFNLFTNMLTGVHEDTYKLTIYTMTSSTTTPNICPANQQFHDALYTGTNVNYPSPFNFAFRDQHIKIENNILYKNAVMLNPSANVTYYTNLILNSLLNHGIDLINYIPLRTQYTICDSVSAVIDSTPQVRVYTANRFVLLNSLVKFENLSLRIDRMTKIVVDFGDGNTPQAFLGLNRYDDFYVNYTQPGYKTLSISYTLTTGMTRTQVFPNIVNVVPYYD